MFFVLLSLNQVLCLHMAARGGDLAKVKNLVENEGDVNIKHNRSGVSIILNYYFDILVLGLIPRCRRKVLHLPLVQP